MKNFVLLLVIAFLTSPATSVCAEGAKITDVLVSLRNGELLVVAKLQGCFTPKMESAILAGIPTSFTFIIDLYQERPFWFDRHLKTITEIKTVKYDLLKKIFYVTAINSKEPLTFHDFEAAKRAMSEYSISIPMPDVQEKKDQGSYYVKMKAKLDKIKLPLKLELILFFVSLWDFETDWYRYPVSF